MNDNYYVDSGQTMFAGIIAGTPLSSFINAMQPNTWSEYTGTNINEMTPREFDGSLMSILESDANYPITNWANKFAWSQSKQVISGVGTSQGFTIPTGYNYTKQVKFDLSNNSFSVKWNPSNQTQGHIYDANCGGFVAGKTWRKAYNVPQLAMYDENTDTWSLSYTLSGLPTVSTIWSIDCNAAHNALYCLEQVTGRLVKFDLATGTRSVIGNYTNVGAYPILVSVGEYIVFGGGDAGKVLYKMNLAGAVTELNNAPPVPYDCRGNYRILEHPSDNTKAICISQSDLKIRTLDIITGTFTDIGTLPSEPQMSASVSASLIGLGAVATWRSTARISGFTQSKFWIYKV